MNEEFSSKSDAIKHGNHLWSNGYRNFALIRQTTYEGASFYYFEWLQNIINQSAIWEEWSL